MYVCINIYIYIYIYSIAHLYHCGFAGPGHSARACLSSLALAPTYERRGVILACRTFYQQNGGAPKAIHLAAAPEHRVSWWLAGAVVFMTRKASSAAPAGQRASEWPCWPHWLDSFESPWPDERVQPRSAEERTETSLSPHSETPWRSAAITSHHAETGNVGYEA